MSTPTTTNPLAILAAIGHDLRHGWRPLLATHLLYSLLTVALLTPLAGAAIRVLVSLSGEAALTDEDILRFALQPLGLLALILGAALVIGLLALRYAALMAIGLWVRHGQRPRALQALWWSLLRAPAVLRLAARMVAWSLLHAVPFLVVGVLLAALLLGRYDINYYLAERPPSFWLAVVLLSLLLLLLVWVLLRLFAGWVHALPLLLFAGRGPGQALRLSRRLSRGRWLAIAGWLLGWFSLAGAVTGILLGLADTVSDWLVPLVGERLRLLAVLLAGLFLLGAVLHLLAGFLNNSLLSLLLVRLTDRRLDHGLPPPPLAEPEPSLNLRRRRVSLRGLLRALAVLGLLAVLGGVVLLDSVVLTDHTRIVAHRGASLAAPENTLAAVRQAIADGAHWVEIDVQETADGTVVVFHDSDFKQAAGLDLKLREATLADLREIDIGSRLDSRFSDERVPTLQEVLELARDRVGVLIELKYYGHAQRLEQRVVDVVEATGMAAQIQIMSLKPEAVKKIREHRPTWPVGLLSSVAVGDALGLDVDFLAVNARFVGADLIRRAHRRGKTIMAWTVNEPLAMSRLIGQGVDGLITDDPALAARVLAERAALNPAERLLLWVAAWSGRAPVYRPQ